MKAEMKLKNEEEVMKLLHYFITEKEYTPIVVHGAKDEIWLENLEEDYKVVRIVSNYIHNNEQFEFDQYKAKSIISKIKRNTFTFKVKAISIFTNLGDNVDLNDIDRVDNIEYAQINKIDDLSKYDFIMSKFPNIINKTKFEEKGMELFMKLTEDINKRTEKDNERVERLFKKIDPKITSVLINMNIIIFLLMYVIGSGSTDIGTLLAFGALTEGVVTNNELWRLIASGFLHIGLAHIFFNMYALYIIGPQIENFFGKSRFIFIYLFSIVIGNFMSLVFYPTNTIGAGASGAIFGLLGALLYFGHYNRVYFGNVIRSRIIPILFINLMIGFSIPGINNAAHIGGLIGGLLAANAVGTVEQKGKIKDIHGIILATIFTSFLIYLVFFM